MKAAAPAWEQGQTDGQQVCKSEQVSSVNSYREMPNLVLLGQAVKSGKILVFCLQWGWFSLFLKHLWMPWSSPVPPR